MSKQVSRRLFLTVMAATLPVVATAQTSAADFPSRPIKIVVPTPPGAATDTLARLLASRLGPKLKGTVIVDNRAGGAGGNVGAESAANSPADGYTLLFAAPGPLVINRMLYPKLGYDSTQFVPVSAVASIDSVLLTRPDAPFKTVRELIDHAKANPGKLNFATGGAGTTTHLAIEMLKLQAGIDLTHVPYKGSAPATAGMMQGQTDLMFVELSSVLQHIRSGRVRALAVGSRQRVSALPEVPTMAETLPSYQVNVWYGLVAPPKTPADISAKLSAAVVEIMKSPDMIATLKGMDIIPIGNSQQEFSRFLQEETERWGAVIRSGNIKAE